MFKHMAMAVALVASWGGVMAEQAYPVRPITLVVGFPPGGGADTVARIVTERMSKVLGQPIVVDNKPGAGTTLAANQVVRAQADGYTLLLASASLYGSDQLLYKSARYDGAKDFTAISRWASSPLLLGVRQDLPSQSVKTLVAQARQAPGRLSYASSGAGVITHLAGLSFTQATKTEMLHVPFRGGAPAIQAVGAGDVDMTFGTPPSVLPMAQNGRLRLLAVTTAERSPLFPDLPGMKESGVEGYDFTLWFGLFGPRGLPQAIQDKLFHASVEALNDPEVQARLARQGNAAEPSASPKAFLEWALQQGEESKRLVERSGASAQ
ncbi:MAG: tripartite tricarboxylate transporter substrate binding protein [Pseudomonadota bacterium]|nr:tripartite tricarboxylate transporter substrate binding protein [Pseudomonadota bacterium]